LIEETEKKKALFQELLNKFSDNKFAQLLFKTTNEAIFFRSWRTERIIQPSYYVIPLFKEIAKHIALTDYHDVLYLLPEEVTSLLKQSKHADVNIIEQRRKAYVYLTLGPKEKLVLQGKEAENMFKEMNLSEKESKEIKGTPAFKGKVQGKIVVVLDHNDYAKIQSADILIAHATIPDMVPYLKNIKAIVTEEGGILSHAAVISREFKIPCVIGTKTATKVLKDGDLVEVDANKGIVRKI
ncbi:hypothetical protein KY339_03755, partial [Candidatus Woesearchaeota archaeon]|nr:hypothetical protein [Candidatus Woesearchaeota archaeon]